VPKLSQRDASKQVELPLHIFIGCDHQQRQAALVLQHSLQRLSSLPLSISLLEQRQLRQAGLDWRERDPLQSTDFSFNRFLVPHLLGFKGWGLYLDGDMLCLSDPAALWAHCDPTLALICVQHPEHLWGENKMNGLIQTSYPRKNWSSMILWNCGHPSNQQLTLEVVNAQTGQFLHRFQWLDDAEIGSLSPEWNWLSGWYNEPQDGKPKAIHYTEGGPWFKEYRRCDYHKIWKQYLREMLK
jgi:lipopolysaccharide biosynthesis glycosyltransferase